MSRKSIIVVLATLLTAGIAFLTTQSRFTFGIDVAPEWEGDWDDWLDVCNGRRRSVSVLHKSKSFEFDKEEFSTRLSYGTTFTFSSDCGGYLIVFLPKPSGGQAYKQEDESQIQRIYVSQRYNARHGIEIMPGSKEGRRLLELVRTASRAPHEQEVQLVLNAIEKRTFDWSAWGGFAQK